MPPKNGNSAEWRSETRQTWKKEGSRPKRRLDARWALRANRAGKRKNALGGPRKSLIRLDSDKENPSLSFDWLWPGLAGFGWIWLDLAGFGSIWIPLGFSLECFPASGSQPSQQLYPAACAPARVVIQADALAAI
jgi:hypothetical protein